jgi:hypothetical protein
VEPDRIKIGRSSAIARRAREIAPLVDWDLSLAAIFASVQEATNCERALHWVFRLYRLKSARGSDTEYFARECLPKLDAFLCEHGGEEMKRGEELRQWLVPVSGRPGGRRARLEGSKEAIDRIVRDPSKGSLYWWIYDEQDDLLWRLGWTFDAASGVWRRGGPHRINWDRMLEEVSRLKLTNSAGQVVKNKGSMKATFWRVMALKKREAEWLARQEAQRPK